jgi:hypothetical protein
MPIGVKSLGPEHRDLLFITMKNFRFFKRLVV